MTDRRNAAAPSGPQAVRLSGEPTLVVVYNADAGPVAALFDAVHKVVSPATYPCSLCAVTYGAVTMRPAWRVYLRRLPFVTTFFHRPDFQTAYPALAAEPLPLIARDDGGAVTILLDAAALTALPTVNALIAALDRRLTEPLVALSYTPSLR